MNLVEFLETKAVLRSEFSNFLSTSYIVLRKSIEKFSENIDCTYKHECIRHCHRYVKFRIGLIVAVDLELRLHQTF